MLRNLQLSIVNSGNTREFPLTLAAHARMMWNFNAYESGRFLDEFCQMYWGENHGPEAANLYRDFFAAYWQQRKPDLPDFPRQYIFQDLRVARSARELLRATALPVPETELLDDRGTGYYRIVPEDNHAGSKVDALLAGNQQAADRFGEVAKRCDDLAPRLDSQGVTFFNQSLRLQAHFMAAASACTAACAQAYKAQNDEAACRRWIEEADQAASQLAEALDAVDQTGPLKGWYAPEKIFGVRETRDMIQCRLKGKAKRD